MYFKWEGGSDRKRCKPTVKTLIVTSLFLDNLYIFYYHIFPIIILVIFIILVLFWCFLTFF